MPYDNQIQASNPTCFVFLIDQSRSMLGLMGGGRGRTKAEAVADALNSLLSNLVRRCVHGREVRDRFFVGVFGYGLSVAPALGGVLAGRDLVPISDVARNPLRVEQRSPAAGGPSAQFPIWFEPEGTGETPTCAALQRAAVVLAGFLAEHPDCYPPVVIHLTDGAANDGDPEAPAERLRQLSSTDGHVLLFNGHVSCRDGEAVEFPDEEGVPDDPLAARLFRMSSRLPSSMLELARGFGYALNDASRGFAFNADLNAVVQFLNISTTVGPKNRP